MINKWNGDLIIDEEQNSILTAKIAAGRKEKDDNTFTGLMLGDWGTAENETGLGKTGLFGFNKGKQSFAFKDDGTAFIGFDGSGRIEFNGDQGIIQTPEFYQGEKYVGTVNGIPQYSYTIEGTKIDLKNGQIYLSDGHFSGDIYIDTSQQEYTEYTYNNYDGSIISKNTKLGGTQETLNSILASLKSNISWTEALSNQNRYLIDQNALRISQITQIQNDQIGMIENIRQIATDAGTASTNATTAVNGLALKLDKMHKFDDNSTAYIDYNAKGTNMSGGQIQETKGIAIIGNGTELRVTDAGIDLGGMMYLTPDSMGIKGSILGSGLDRTKYYILSFELV